MENSKRDDFYNGDEEEHGLSIWQCVALFMAAQAAALGVIEWIIR